ncbi:hypothetical protein [Polaribacter sp.]|uniref:hypothetical protein n=1 Tax=Polaribacter sp. TaxID=1920175 RepID=UPI003EF65D66
MNYGKEFIELYNKDFSTFKKEILARIKEDHDSPKMEEELYATYKNEIHGKMNEIRENDNKDEKSSSLIGYCIASMNKKYKVDRIQNIINLDIYNYFQNYKQYTQYKDFKHFLQLYSKFLVLHNYGSFLDKNSQDFCTQLRKEKIKAFFNIKYIKDDLNILVLNNKKELQKESKELVSKLIELEDNEKSILLNILFFHLNDSLGKDIPITEKYRLLILCSSVLKEEDFSKIKTGYKTFDYFKLGTNKTQKFKGDKRIAIENIIDKLKKLNGLKEIINSIKILKNRDSFYS